MPSRPDPYTLHRAALAPLLPDSDENIDANHVSSVIRQNENVFTHFLLRQGLGPLWDELLDTHALLLNKENRQQIHGSRLKATGGYLLQNQRMKEACAILDEAQIDHVVIKGCHTRETYYNSPALRPAVDIDILIRAKDKIQAIKAFQIQDYTFHAVPENIAQDCSLLKGDTAIDLHWDILRPGRCRVPMVDTILSSRIRFPHHWGPSHAATLFLMLVHPVFKKYSTTPHASIVRLVDLLLLLNHHPEAIDPACVLLQTAGLQTAGWLTVTWLYSLTNYSPAFELSERLAPNTLRRKYLNWWLSRNLSTQHLKHPTLVQVAYTLPAHDTLHDAIHALRSARKLRALQAQMLADTKKQLT